MIQFPNITHDDVTVVMEVCRKETVEIGFSRYIAVVESHWTRFPRSLLA